MAYSLLLPAPANDVRVEYIHFCTPDARVLVCDPPAVSARPTRFIAQQASHLRRPLSILSVALQIECPILLGIGRIRGWSFASVGLRISWKMTGVGPFLFTSIAPAIRFLAKPAGIIDAASNPGPLTGVVTMAVVIG